MKISTIRIADLKRPERNVRIHPEKQIRELVRSVQMFGQTRPMVVDENFTVLVGNGLMTALERMGAETADCYVIPNLSAAEKKKLMLADNQIQRLGIDDADAFDQIIAELGADVDVPGYDDQLLKMLNTEAESADDMFNGYGIVSDAHKEQFTQASVRYERQDAEFTDAAEQIIPNAAGTPLQRPFQPIQDNAPLSHSPEAASVSDTIEGFDAPTPIQRRFLICPKCGEKIWL